MARNMGCEAVYEIADQWRERCLVHEGSLLWPDEEEPTWTSANIASLINAFLDRPDYGGGNFLEKWRAQLGDLPNSIHRIAADALAIYSLFPVNMKKESKLNNIHEVLSWKPQRTPELQLLERAYECGLGHSGQMYLIARPEQIAYYLRFGQLVHERNVDPSSLASVLPLADEVNGMIRKSQASRHILLHLLFPDDFESIASRDHKQRIISELGRGMALPEDKDRAILMIRRSLESELGREDVHFYQGDVYPRWNPPDSNDDISNASSEVARPHVHEDGASKSEHLSITALDSLAQVTHHSSDELEMIESLLHHKKQIILEGPPGSGKTYLARLFARYLAELPLEGGPDPQVEIVQFHQSYGYEDFVAGIRPRTTPEGAIRYDVQPGIFTEMGKRAEANPTKNFVLIIDEINRGNLSRIFGELLYALEYRDEPVRIQYPDMMGDESADHLTIPGNLYLIGTMNSTDRSLAMIDYALRRRFYFWSLMPVVDHQAPVLEGWLRARGVDEELAQSLLSRFVALNERIADQMSPDHQIGHSYLMVDDLDNPETLERVWKRALLPLLGEYFHNRRDREAPIDELRGIMLGN